MTSTTLRPSPEPSKPRLTTAKEIQESILPSTSDPVPRIEAGTSTNGEAIECMREGHFARAETLFLRALRISEEEFGSNHVNTGVCLTNIGMLYLRKGTFEPAEGVLRDALRIFVRTYGEDHEQTGRALLLMSIACSHLERWKDAEADLKRALHIFEDLDARHELIPACFVHLASVHLFRFRADRARYEAQQLGARRPNPARLAAAEHMLRRASAVIKKKEKRSDDDVDTTQCLHRLAMLYILQDKREPAVTLIKRLKARYLRTVGARPGDEVDVAELEAMIEEEQRAEHGEYGEEDEEDEEDSIQRRRRRRRERREARDARNARGGDSEHGDARASPRGVTAADSPRSAAYDARISPRAAYTESSRASYRDDRSAASSHRPGPQASIVSAVDALRAGGNRADAPASAPAPRAYSRHSADRFASERDTASGPAVPRRAGAASSSAVSEEEPDPTAYGNSNRVQRRHASPAVVAAGGGAGDRS